MEVSAQIHLLNALSPEEESPFSIGQGDGRASESVWTL
jgi:hypothetical protein